MSKISAGEVTFTLGGEERTLKCFLEAAESVSNRFGGFDTAIQRVIALDLSAITFIVNAGLGTKTEKDTKKIAQLVYEEGVAELCVPVARFAGNLARGGRPRKGEEDDDTGEAPAAA